MCINIMLYSENGINLISSYSIVLSDYKYIYNKILCLPVSALLFLRMRVKRGKQINRCTYFFRKILRLCRNYAPSHIACFSIKTQRNKSC